MTNQPTNPFPYDLALAQNSDRPSRLTSPLLDETMHHGHAVDVTFEPDDATTTPGTCGWPTSETARCVTSPSTGDDPIRRATPPVSLAVSHRRSPARTI
jgi:hypothetical protein